MSSLSLPPSRSTSHPPVTASVLLLFALPPTFLLSLHAKFSLILLKRRVNPIKKRRRANKTDLPLPPSLAQAIEEEGSNGGAGFFFPLLLGSSASSTVVIPGREEVRQQSFLSSLAHMEL